MALGLVEVVVGDDRSELHGRETLATCLHGPMPRAQANGIEIEYEEAGSPDDPALLLSVGFTAQMTHWHDDSFRRRLHP